jgi:hypothetical protein
LVGRKNESRMVLTKATQAQATAYNNGDLAKGLLFKNLSKYVTYFKRVTLGGVTYEITVNQTARTIKLTWLEGTTPKTFTTNFYYTADGVTFVSPLVNGSRTINGFSNITWNANTSVLGLSGGGASGTVVSAVKPLSVDIAASRRWWQAPIESGGDWRTADAFHVNGVDDAFGVKDLTFEDAEYAFYIYQPGANASYDLMGPVFYDGESISLEYAHAPKKPTFLSDGRILFTEYGKLGPVPTTGPAAQTAELLYDGSGFYLIQTSESTYDMVSAKDAKAWISWQ